MDNSGAWLYCGGASQVFSSLLAVLRTKNGSLVRAVPPHLEKCCSLGEVYVLGGAPHPVIVTIRDNSG